MHKFTKVPVEQDTKIIFRREIKLGEYEVLHEKWSWDGISGESIIFLDEDVAHLSEEDIKKEVRELLNKDSKMTFKRNKSGFTFVNFNFQT